MYPYNQDITPSFFAETIVRYCLFEHFKQKSIISSEDVLRDFFFEEKKMVGLTSFRLVGELREVKILAVEDEDSCFIDAVIAVYRVLSQKLGEKVYPFLLLQKGISDVIEDMGYADDIFDIVLCKPSKNQLQSIRLREPEFYSRLSDNYTSVQPNGSLVSCYVEFSTRFIQLSNGIAAVIMPEDWTQKLNYGGLRRYLTRHYFNTTIYHFNGYPVAEYSPEYELCFFTAGTSIFNYIKLSCPLQDEGEFARFLLDPIDEDIVSEIHVAASSRPWNIIDKRAQHILDLVSDNPTLKQVAEIGRTPMPDYIELRRRNGRFLYKIRHSKDYIPLVGLSVAFVAPFHNSYITKEQFIGLIESKVFAWYYGLMCPLNLDRRNTVSFSALREFPCPKAGLKSSYWSSLQRISECLISTELCEMIPNLIGTDGRRYGRYVRMVLDLLVFEMYFPEEMQMKDIQVLPVIEKFLDENSDLPTDELVLAMYRWVLNIGSPIRNIWKVLETRSYNILHYIVENS